MIRHPTIAHFGISDGEILALMEKCNCHGVLAVDETGHVIRSLCEGRKQGTAAGISLIPGRSETSILVTNGDLLTNISYDRDAAVPRDRRQQHDRGARPGAGRGSLRHRRTEGIPHRWHPGKAGLHTFHQRRGLCSVPGMPRTHPVGKGHGLGEPDQRSHPAESAIGGFHHFLFVIKPGS